MQANNFIQGYGAPLQHPDTIGKAHVDQVHFSQRLPYHSEILKTDAQMAQVLDDALAPICQYVNSIISTFLPSEYLTVKAFVDVLPLNHYPTSYPFGSFVVNIQALTGPHKDAWDDTFCVVIPFGLWTKGQLVLYEAGIVLELVVGDVAIFPSYQITHFNLAYEGIRCSLVFFSDRHGRDWVRFRNGWDGHMVVKTLSDPYADINSPDCAEA